MTNPDRVAFNVFGRDIYWYGVLIAVGILSAIFLAMREAKRKGMHEDTVLDLCLLIIPCGIIGARLYYVLCELDQYMHNPIEMLYIWNGGLAIYGGVIGGMIAMWLYSKKKKIRFLKLADIMAPGLVLAQGLGRWGNFFNQEAFGLPITNEKLMWFPFAVRIDGPHMFNDAACTNPYHLATFFYESVWCFLVFIFLWVRRKKFKHDGDVFLWYAFLYSFERMFVEGLRGDSLWLIDGVIRISQLLSALMFVGIGLFFIIRSNKEKKLGKLVWPSMEEAPEKADEAPSASDESNITEETQTDEEAGAEATEAENADIQQPDTESIDEAQADDSSDKEKEQK